MYPIINWLQAIVAYAINKVRRTIRSQQVVSAGYKENTISVPEAAAGALQVVLPVIFVMDNFHQ